MNYEDEILNNLYNELSNVTTKNLLEESKILEKIEERQNILKGNKITEFDEVNALEYVLKGIENGILKPFNAINNNLINENFIEKFVKINDSIIINISNFNKQKLLMGSYLNITNLENIIGISEEVFNKNYKII